MKHVIDTRPKTPRPEDVAIGRRIRARRTVLGISQERLGMTLGLTFQQVQKYEKGTNRVAGSRLTDICTALNCTANYLTTGKDDPKATTPKQPDVVEELLAQHGREAVGFITNLMKMDSIERRRLFSLIEALAAR